MHTIAILYIHNSLVYTSWSEPCISVYCLVLTFHSTLSATLAANTGGQEVAYFTFAIPALLLVQ